jgi:hypothetical protein
MDARRRGEVKRDLIGNAWNFTGVIIVTKSMSTNTLEALEARIKTILPEEYQDRYEEMEPVPMRSAGLKFGNDGKVAWDEIWGSFCDLAMAGGPPHKGSLLEPGSAAEIEAQPERYAEVVAEICRGIGMATELTADASDAPGWVRVGCDSHGMAEWLERAITMENVATGCDETILELPAAPGFRLEKEIKNVITVIAKTCHYWASHMWPAQHRDIAKLFIAMDSASPLVRPGNDFATDGMAAAIEDRTGLRVSEKRYRGWIGVECPSVRAAIWMMRAMVASNVLARREGTVLFIALNRETDARGEAAVGALARVYGFAAARGV